MDEVERWKFEMRQAMLDYARSEKLGDSAGTAATWTRACDLVDELAAKIDAERERMLSTPNLMHACDALGVRPDGEHCEILRRTLVGAGIHRKRDVQALAFDV